MKVDTHGLLLAAALFGPPTVAGRAAQWDTSTLPPDLPASQDEVVDEARSACEFLVLDPRRDR
jgi:hypothetical protein